MRFTVSPRLSYQTGRSSAVLVIDNWDDFGFKTMFRLFVFDDEGQRHDVGYVKVGRRGMQPGPRTRIPESFEVLDSDFFSLGQNDEYYSNLNLLGPETRDEVLESLRDVAAIHSLFEETLTEDVMATSLLREVSPQTVRGQFRRMAAGGSRLSAYSFSYQPPGDQTVDLRFTVEPESQPPTNVHVLIGRNGVGKTRTLHLLSRAFTHPSDDEVDVGRITIDENTGSEGFAGLVSVAFSAFDPFEPLELPDTRSAERYYVYVGLKQPAPDTGSTLGSSVPSSDELANQFARSLASCAHGPRRERWLRAIRLLESDPMIAASSLPELIDLEDRREAAVAAFSAMSSGHKIVLLSITRLVEVVEERTLVLFDEPESHLHPPLLAALVRTLSDLMTDRNGVALIATHSPVVLQEVPRSCVWTIRRSGLEVRADRPSVETFGENVGVLTREVFGLEVTHSGFHRLVADAVEDGLGYNEVTARFDDQLGGEARSIARSLTARRDQDA